VILAGILLKMGVYGYIRFAIPLFPEAMIFLKPYLMTIAVVGIIYGALVAMVQPNMKKLIAYSSVSHMGVVMLGVFALNQTAMTGGLYQMLNHGISTGALFLLAGMVYDRTHTLEIKDYSGLAKLMPVYAVFFLIATLSSIAVPLTNGFVGEFLALLGSYQVSPVLTIIATTGVIFGAVYMLWLVQRIFFGPEKKMDSGTIPALPLHDLNWKEVVGLIPMVILIFVMGVYPKPFLEKLERPAETVLLKLDDERELVNRKKFESNVGVNHHLSLRGIAIQK
jgi:NADH-quinone oxidoreductase subunit M